MSQTSGWPASWMLIQRWGTQQGKKLTEKDELEMSAGSQSQKHEVSKTEILPEIHRGGGKRHPSECFEYRATFTSQSCLPVLHAGVNR